MKKTATVLAILLLLVSVAATAQSVNDTFSSMRGWTPGAGDWAVQGGRLVQQDAGENLARIDRRLTQSGEYELEFTIRYVGGGYDSEMAMRNGEYYGGFGIHLGVEDPALGRASWGAGNSYLLWLNLDTRATTRENAPEHFGFRAQVYESESNSSMALAEDPALSRDPMLSQVTMDNLMSIDIERALRAWGVVLTMEDAQRFVGVDVPINIRVNTRTGEIGVKDPTAPVRFYFSVDPTILRGTYVSLRTNNIAAAFDSFTVE